MTLHIRIATLAATVVLAAASNAVAQTDPEHGIYINVSGGGQTAERTLTTGLTFPLYDQTASVASAQTSGGSGLFDLSIGYRVRPNIIGVFGFSTTSTSGDLVGTAVIPHPLFFNRPQTSTFDAEVDRSEQSYYLQALWMLPITDKIDFALGIGPSFTRVSQETLARVDVPAGTQQANPVIEKRKGTAGGVIVSIDAAYMFTPRYGAGGFVRFNGGGSTRVTDDQKLKAGGFQTGIGLRLRL